MAKLKAELFKGRKTAACRVTFRIPMELASVLGSAELENVQKINLVKSYTDKIKGDDGKYLPRIPQQQAVVLIMALEVGAL